MKTIRELINLIETAQTPMDDDVEHLANAFADIYYGGAGMGMISATEKVKLARNIVQAVDAGRLSVEQLKQDLKDVGELQQKLGRDGRFDKPGVAEGQATRTCPQCDGSGEDTLDPTKSCRRCGGKGHIPMSPREQGVAEALSKTDLLKQVSAELNDPKFRKKPVDPTKSFTRGDHWQGAKPGDYGYTGYQGHGMPTDKQERDRIRADKKKQQDK